MNSGWRRGGGRGGAPSGPSRKERRQSQRDEDEREKRRAARKEKEGGEKSKIQWMPLLFLFFIVGPGIMPAVLWAGDYVADTSLGKSIAAGCADIGLCRSYEQQLTDLYMQNNPKKVKEVRSYFLVFVPNIREIRDFNREMQRTNRESITIYRCPGCSGSG
eukprot:SAG31_NODE_628_length_13432_cov_131.456086_12_plen_161_part_00